MTRKQRFLIWLGLGRLRAFRRHVGGRWVLHCSGWHYPLTACNMQWEHDPIVAGETYATEIYPRIPLPRAITRTRLVGAACGGHDDQASEEERLRL